MKPASTLIMVTTREIRRPMTMMLSTPAPNHTIRMGPRAIFGRAFKELKYAILVARPAVGESVILDVSLAGLGPYLKLYSSGRKHVLLAEQLMKEYGPEAFVDKYLEVA